MGRKSEPKSTGASRLRNAVEAVRRVFTRGRSAEPDATEIPAMEAQPRQPRSSTTPSPARTTRRETDIPLDALAGYNPPLTSSKASFRSDGADHQSDQEFSRGVADRDWNDEDHFTNKSGDPRIGTRRRTYEPNETRDESRDEQR